MATRNDAGGRAVRAAPLFVAAALAGAAWPGVALAQGPGEADRGRQLAVTLCAACHRIGAGDQDGQRVPPDFGAIAAMPSMTELALRVFLQTPHGQMPRYRLAPGEMDDVIAYLSGLKPR